MNTKQARIIKGVIQVIVYVGLSYLVRHKVAETHATVWIAASWLLTAWVVLRVSLAIKRAHATFRAHTATGVNLGNLNTLASASSPPWMRGSLEMEARAHRGTWRTVTRVPLVSAGEFLVAGGPKHGRRTVAALLLVLAATVLGALYLPQLATSFWPRTFWSVGTVLGGMYAASWIVGDRRNLKEGGHRIESGTLILDLGLRSAAVVPLERIAACRAIEAGMAPLPADQVWTASAGERPNVLIELAGEAPLPVTSFGSPREISKRYIALYVDRPAALAEAVTAAHGLALRACAA